MSRTIKNFPASEKRRSGRRDVNKADLDIIVEESLRAAAIWDELKDRLKKNALGLSGGQQ